MWKRHAAMQKLQVPWLVTTTLCWTWGMVWVGVLHLWTLICHQEVCVGVVLFPFRGCLLCRPMAGACPSPPAL